MPLAARSDETGKADKELGEQGEDSKTDRGWNCVLNMRLLSRCNRDVSSQPETDASLAQSLACGANGVGCANLETIPFQVLPFFRIVRDNM